MLPTCRWLPLILWLFVEGLYLLVYIENQSRKVSYWIWSFGQRRLRRPGTLPGTLEFLVHLCFRIHRTKHGRMQYMEWPRDLHDRFFRYLLSSLQPVFFIEWQLNWLYLLDYNNNDGFHEMPRGWSAMPNTEFISVTPMSAPNWSRRMARKCILLDRLLHTDFTVLRCSFEYRRYRETAQTIPTLLTVTGNFWGKD